MTTTEAPATTTLRIRYTRTATHIEGFAPATTGGGNDMGDHVSYSADSHCSSLTRNGYRMGYVTETIERRHTDDANIPAGKVRCTTVAREFDTAQAAYDAALAYARRNQGERICAKCAAAAAAAGATV
jgi:hypothetical protein